MEAELFAAYRDRVLAERDGLRKALGDLRAAQDGALRHLLSANADTEFGRRHGFAGCRNVDDFRAAVPIADYEALGPWMEAAAAGRPNVLSADPPVVFFKSSGSTGDSKRIPVTREFMRTSFFPPYYAAWANIVEHHPEAVRRPDATLNLKHDPAPAADATRSGHPHLGASQVDFGRAFGERLSAEPGSRAPWSTLPSFVDPADHPRREYVRLRTAMAHDVRCVIGINPAVVAALLHQLVQWWPRLVKDVYDGTVDGRPGPAPDPERARLLDRLAERTGAPLPAHVWPRMEVLFCWTTGLASLYLPRLREAFGFGVSALPAPAAASEGFVAVALDRHPTAGSPAITGGLLEFVDADEELSPGSDTLLCDELATGGEYHVVLSHVGGLYRYALGDVVRVVDRAGGVPRLEYAGRRTLSDAAGERLREGHVVSALHGATRATGLEIRNATCRVTGHPPRPGAPEPGADGPQRYAFAVEPFGRWSHEETEAFARALDSALGGRSDGYRAARASARLGAVVLHRVAPGGFAADWQARVARGTRPAQVKDRVFQNDDAAWRRLLGT
ncbi:GH3 auxin-responsive promoter family protein [Streptomyces sp. YS415]|uniref:GH3 auxin-responsive promoter family protein n=1 Tax=Streptomyces sp. YS415 TaxID=2944806 RepID=UPI0020225752|nr:GH3 auxin-responsive promoter family protein [Streptomyces sp. YS415]MCL7427803.1 GH3 auxin-responsive promoter family protein [Streptomyces sp. YS415]